jgi:tetratricopeptide (TPR) repeat protein
MIFWRLFLIGGIGIGVLLTPYPLSLTTAWAEPTPHPTEMNNIAVQEAQAGRFEQAAAVLREALELAPADDTLRKNLSGILTDWSARLYTQGKADTAVEILEEAVELNPENGKGLMALGNLYYVLKGNLEGAVRVWRQAYGKVPASEWNGISRVLAQAQRDLRIERAFAGVRTEHFLIRFEGSAFHESAVRIGDVLESEYSRLSKTVGRAPSALSVIVYTQSDFQRVAGRMDWAVGLYDGRIRLRVEDVDQPWIRNIIAHELAHAFITESYGPQIPPWIHEGFAQVQEPVVYLPSPRQERILESLESRAGWVPLAWLDRRFKQPSHTEDLERAYEQARMVIAFLVDRYGVYALRDFLKELSRGQPIEQAFNRFFAPSRWSRVNQGNFD